MDRRCPLDDVLDVLRVRGSLSGYIRAHAPWGLTVPPVSGAAFHAVAVGGLWLRMPGRPARELLAGDLVLLPTGAEHIIASDPSAATRPWDRAAKAKALDASGEIVLKGTGRSTHVICAWYDYDHDVSHPLLSLLPRALVLSGHDAVETSPLQATLRLLRHELAAGAAGSATVIARLIDVLFVHVMREWITRQHDHGASWLGALRDPSIGRALTLMHSSPAAPWTLASLAREANVSRATLTRRFSALVGEAPLAYLTRWRMDLAARDLRETDHAVSAIAHRVGYASEFAFSRAFSRARGQPPGRYRTVARGRAATG